MSCPKIVLYTTHVEALVQALPRALISESCSWPLSFAREKPALLRPLGYATGHFFRVLYGDCTQPSWYRYEFCHKMRVRTHTYSSMHRNSRYDQDADRGDSQKFKPEDIVMLRSPTQCEHVWDIAGSSKQAASLRSTDAILFEAAITNSFPRSAFFRVSPIFASIPGTRTEFL